MFRVKVTTVGFKGEWTEVKFSDGHRALIEPFRYGMRTGIKLYKGTRQVFDYDPIDGSMRAVREYGHKKVATYWRAAFGYFEAMFTSGVNLKDEYWFTWKALQNSKPALETLEHGIAELLISQ